MKLLTHDAYYSFDYTLFANDVYDFMIDRSFTPETAARDLQMSASTVYHFFNYQSVSLPTMLRIACWAELNLMKYLIRIT
jgi:hypothetical protein